VVPQDKVIALLVNPNDPNAERFIRGLPEAARVKSLQLQVGEYRERDRWHFRLAQAGVGGLVVSPNALFVGRREQVEALASRHAVSAIYPQREFAAAGGLISYGTSLPDTYRQLSIYVGKILNGAKPADLPTLGRERSSRYADRRSCASPRGQQPTTFERVVNLKTARALGLTIPQKILAPADEVSE
jgi:putative ABC transport system substrate-binding protein